jgi:hypothetical protein
MRVVGPDAVRDKEQFVGTPDDGGHKEVDSRNRRNGMGRCCRRQSHRHDRKLGNRISINTLLKFSVTFLREWRELVIELGQAWSMKCGTPIHDGKVSGNFEGLNGRETFNACLFEWLRRDWLVELSIPRIGTINWFKWNQFCRIR